MCAGFGSDGLKCACMHSFTMCVLGHPGGQRRGSHTYTPEAHSPLAHTHPRPAAVEDHGSGALGMHGWACKPPILRFGQIVGTRPTAMADRGIGPGILNRHPLPYIPGYQGQPSRGFQDVYPGLPRGPNHHPKLEACARAGL